MLESFNLRIIGEYLPLYWQGLWATAWLSFLSLVGALLVGATACVLRLSSARPVFMLSGAYIESIRSTPLLAQLYFFYFGLPTLGLRLTEVQTGILALSLNSGAYIAEILRAGILAISPGQIEAAVSSGLNYFQRLRYIVLPQALAVVLPPLLGQAIVLVKDSALLSLISVLELTRAGQVLTSERFMPLEGFTTTAVFYLVLYYALKSLTTFSQRRLGRHQVR
ncbi:MAG: amino acid ABC transporter permease [Thermodesulfobacteriota bacterium]